MKKIKTLIDYAKDKPEKGCYALKAEGTWFNGKGKLPAELKIGVPVEIEYNTNERGFHNLSNYRVMSSTEELDPMMDLGKKARVTVKGRDRMIRMQAFLKCASTIIGGASPEAGDFSGLEEHAWNMAKNFEKRGEEEGLW